MLTYSMNRWLAQTSRACGWKPPEKPLEKAKSSNVPRGPRLKGKERKLTKEAANALPTRNATTTGELLQQAEVVASSKRFRMPQSIGRVLKRAISARTKCAT